MAARILLVEDDTTARLLLAKVLKGADYDVTTVASGGAALELLEQQSFDVVITDIRLGKIDGIEVLKAARTQSYTPSVILLTGYGSLQTALDALRAGASDYLLKPCPPTELLACVARVIQSRKEEQNQMAALRTIAQGLAQLQRNTQSDFPPTATPTDTNRTTGEPADRYVRVGQLVIDSFRHSVTFDGQALRVTPIEYALLHCLAMAQGRVQSYSDIVRHTHGHETDDIEAQALLKAHVHNLRRKIDPAYLINVRGSGYMLAEPENAPSSSSV
jgi:DNA-binding response OmpR family regulator